MIQDLHTEIDRLKGELNFASGLRWVAWSVFVYL